MHVTARVNYALQAMIELASSDFATLPASTLAERLGLSYNYLLSIVGDLRRAGFVKMHRGQAGGLQLARPADTIMLSEIIRAIDGPLTLANGMAADTSVKCESGGQLQLESLWAAAHQAMLDVFARVPLSDLGSINLDYSSAEAVKSPGVRAEQHPISPGLSCRHGEVALYE